MPSIETTQSGGVLQIRLTVPALFHDPDVAMVEKEVGAAIAEGDLAVLLDFGAVQSIGSRALGFLLELRDQLGDQKRRLGVVNLSRDVRFLFDTMRLGAVLPVYEDLERARSDLGRPA